VVDDDSVVVTLKLADGSNASIIYVAEGDKGLAKERVEIFGSGKTFVIDDFRATASYAGGKENSGKSSKQDKGQAEEIKRICSLVVNGGEAPIALDDLAATTRATFRILESLKTARACYI